MLSTIQHYRFLYARPKHVYMVAKPGPHSPIHNMQLFTVPLKTRHDLRNVYTGFLIEDHARALATFEPDAFVLSILLEDAHYYSDITNTPVIIIKDAKCYVQDKKVQYDIAYHQPRPWLFKKRMNAKKKL